MKNGLILRKFTVHIPPHIKNPWWWVVGLSWNPTDVGGGKGREPPCRPSWALFHLPPSFFQTLNSTRGMGGGGGGLFPSNDGSGDGGSKKKRERCEMGQI